MILVLVAVGFAVAMAAVIYMLAARRRRERALIAAIAAWRGHAAPTEPDAAPTGAAPPAGKLRLILSA